MYIPTLPQSQIVCEVDKVMQKAIAETGQNITFILLGKVASQQFKMKHGDFGKMLGVDCASDWWIPPHRPFIVQAGLCVPYLTYHYPFEPCEPQSTI